MGFVLKARWQRSSAFGCINASRDVVQHDIKACLDKSSREAKRWSEPSTGKGFPLDRLRRQMAHAMRLDVVFSRKITETVGEDGKKHWSKTPVWKVAQKHHYTKALRVSSMLHEIVVHGWRNPAILHDLVQLSVQIWALSLKDFSGLCRTILSKIVKALRAYRSSPDPLARMGTLTSNPILSGRVCRHPPARRDRCHGPRYRPKCLDLLVMKLEKRHSRCALSARCLRQTT